LQTEGLVISGHPAFGGRPARGKHARNSRHYRDLAIDINAPGNIVEADHPQWKTKFNELATRIQGAGFAVKWNDDSNHRNHIHASVGRPEGRIVRADNGGIFDGPDGGYPIEMHGSEMVSPLNMNSVLMKLAKTPATESAKNIAAITSSKSDDTIKPDALYSNILKMNSDIANMLDRVIDVLENDHSTQSKILKNSYA
jgi:hypothetical protein